MPRTDGVGYVVLQRYHLCCLFGIGVSIGLFLSCFESLVLLYLYKYASYNNIMPQKAEASAKVVELPSQLLWT
jgi:hypothetical protein